MESAGLQHGGLLQGLCYLPSEMAALFFLRILPGSWMLPFYLHPVGQNLITWPFLAAREAGNGMSQMLS